MNKNEVGLKEDDFSFFFLVSRYSFHKITGQKPIRLFEHSPSCVD